jgi:predicted NUDIX family phosphoesterase
MSREEQILVIETDVFRKLGLFHGLRFDTDRYLKAIFAPGVCRFMPRPEAEQNPEFKQLIPYVLITCNGKYLSYVRGKRAGETRLVSKRSMGIGGHINPVDDMSLFGDFRETYLNAVQREVEEEIHVESPYTDRVVALLNDDTNEVGRVHLGVVHLWTLEEPKVARREQMITQLDFHTPDELEKISDTMETWSQLCLEGITSGQLK